MEDTVQVKVNITGRVQGVFFRVECQKAALMVGRISGYVKNMPDGSVEAVFSGPKDRVDRMLAWCEKGPPLGRVDEVSRQDPEVEASFTDFDIRY